MPKLLLRWRYQSRVFFLSWTWGAGWSTVASPIAERRGVARWRGVLGGGGGGGGGRGGAGLGGGGGGAVLGRAAAAAPPITPVPKVETLMAASAVVDECAETSSDETVLEPSAVASPW